MGQDKRDVQDPNDPANWGAPAASNLRLVQNRDVEVRLATRTKVQRVRREDVFEVMHTHPRSKLTTAAYQAVRRFQGDLAILHRTTGAQDAVRTTCRGARSWVTENFALARVEAGDRVQEVLDGIPLYRHRQLIRTLCEHEVVRGSQPNWRWVCQQVMGTTDRVKQADDVREAAEALAESYSVIDNLPGERTIAAFA